MKNWFRSKSGVFFSILFPVMLLLVFGTVFGGQGTTEYSIQVQNKDITTDGEPTNLSKTFIETLNSTKSFNVDMVDPEINITKYMKQNQSASSRALVIPRDFQEKAIQKSMGLRTDVILDTMIRIRDGYQNKMNESEERNLTLGLDALKRWENQIGNQESAEIFLLIDEQDQATEIIKGIISGVVNEFNQKMMGAKDSTIEVTMGSVAKENIDGSDYYLPGLIAAFIMANGIIGVTGTVTEYRRNGTMKRLASTPLTKAKWMRSWK